MEGGGGVEGGASTMDCIRGDYPVSILRLRPLQGDGHVGGGIDAGSRLANRLCTKLM